MDNRIAHVYKNMIYASFAESEICNEELIDTIINDIYQLGMIAGKVQMENALSKRQLEEKNG